MGRAVPFTEFHKGLADMPTTKIEKLGNIPAARNTYFADKKPDLLIGSDQRASYLRFKTDKESNTLRSSMAVFVNLLTPSTIIHGTERGTEFLQCLVNECQDAALKACAEEKADFDVVQDFQKLIADYFDNSRTASGKRVSAENVGTFFDRNMKEWLECKVTTKFPAFDADKTAKVVAQYRAAFADLSKYQMPHTKAVYSMLDKAWTEFLTGLVDTAEVADSEMVEWIAARMEKLNNRLNADEMLIDAI